MILRVDRIAHDIPRSPNPDANAASVVQELLGGKYGEMSTLMNYTMQSFNMRGRSKIRPFYDLVANIAAEEYGHIELVSYTINMLLTGNGQRDPDPVKAPLEKVNGNRYSDHFVNSGNAAVVADSMGRYWDGGNVTNTGNLKTDLVFNFHLECCARAGKIRAYESTSNPTARAMIGYLLVRGGVHIVAYAKAIEKLTGFDIGKILPVPDISNNKFPEAKKLQDDQGLHRILYQFSVEDYAQAGKIFNGPHPEDGGELKYMHLPKDYGVPAPDLEAEPHLGAPLDPETLAAIEKKMK